MRQGGDIMTLVRGTMFLLPGKKLTTNQQTEAKLAVEYDLVTDMPWTITLLD